MRSRQKRLKERNLLWLPWWLLPQEVYVDFISYVIKIWNKIEGCNFSAFQADHAHREALLCWQAYSENWFPWLCWRHSLSNFYETLTFSTYVISPITHYVMTSSYLFFRNSTGLQSVPLGTCQFKKVCRCLFYYSSFIYFDFPKHWGLLIRVGRPI